MAQLPLVDVAHIWQRKKMGARILHVRAHCSNVTDPLRLHPSIQTVLPRADGCVILKAVDAPIMSALGNVSH